MKDKNKVLAKVVCAVMSMMLVTGAAACNPTQDKDLTFDNQGIYYTEVDGQEYQFTINDKSFELVLDGETLEGKYTFDGTKINLTFDGSKGTGTATYANGVLTVDYNGKQYVMVKKTAYTVTYNVNGGSAVEPETVYNGKLATKPQDPVKDGYIFVGWYKDAEFKEVFDFETQTITANTTVYAYFIEKNPVGEEFEVKFELGYEGESLAPVKTVGGKLLNLPEPKREGFTFIGWWLSDFENAEKLTCQYTDQQLLRATTLYAVWSGDGVAISVTEKRISWNSKGVNVSYNVNVYDSSDKVLFTKAVSATSVDYDFGALESGEYKVTVTARGTTSEAYYLNKALAAVTHFEVQEPSLLKFNAVPYATKYLITVVCGDPGHKHVDVDLGNSTEFDFSNCEMAKDGISFVVKAVADGYASSTSEPFVFSRALAAVEGLTVDTETESVVWNAVENATSYVIEVKCDNADHNHAPENIGNVTTYSILECTGNVVFSVYPVAKGYNSPEAASVTYNKTRLAVPQNIRVENYLLKWNAVEGAEKYEVKIGENTYQTDKSEFDLTSYLSGSNDYEVSVRSLAGASGANSLYSNALSLSFGKISNAKYAANIVSWNYVVGATKYLVKVNDGEAVETSTNNAEVVLTKGGNNTVSVSYVDQSGKQSAWTDVNVTAYTMSFNSKGGKEADSLYLATGDKVVLPQTEKDGYSFIGWYDADSVRYTDEKFAGTQDIKLYAYWTGEEYTVTYEVGSEGTMEETSTVVVFGQKYVLPVPSTDDLTKAFGGWYTEPNGVGRCFADYEGVCLKAWDEFKDMKLYAFWVDTLSFELIDGGQNYAVKKGSATNRLKEITVPAMYNGKPVTVIDGGAFLSCNNLITVNIPDSIVTIFTGADGTEGAASCFQGCSSLKAVNIYKPTDYPGAYEVFYESYDGVLLYNNPYTGKEINFCPANKTGEFEIPYGVEVLPTNVFKSNRFTKISVPATVTKIEKDAFRSSYNLTEIVFLPEKEGVEEKPLNIGETAFYSCSKLTSITLPKRLATLHRSLSSDKKTSTVDVFNSCSALIDINIDGEGGYFTSVDGVLCVNDDLGKTIYYCPTARTGEYTIPNTVVAIGEAAFKSCKIEKLIIPGYVSRISKYAFQSCTYLTEIEFQGKANDIALTIEESAFYSCSGLTEVKLPANLKVLKENAFGGTSKLKTVTVNCVGNLEFEPYAFHTTSKTSYIETLYLGPSVGLIDVNGVFGGNNLKSVIVDERNMNYTSDNGVLYDRAVTIIVYYPKGRGGNYQIPSTIQHIGVGVFKNATELESVFINKNIKSIGMEAFSGCSKIAELIFEEGGTAPLTIGNNAFYGCRALTSVTLPKRTASIGDEVFYNCSLLTEIKLNEGLKEIGDKAFYYCSALKEITIPSTVEKIEMYEAKENNVSITRMRLFDYCSKLENIYVTEGNDKFASINGVLYGKTDGVVTDLYVCPKLYEGVVDLPKTINKIWSRAFYQVVGATELKFSEGIVGDLEIGSEVFYGCTTLTKISLPNGLKSIGKNMFQNCSSIEEIVIPNTVESIGENAFNGCKSLASIIFEEGGTAPLVLEDGRVDSNQYQSTYYGVFVGCPALKKLVLPARTEHIGDYAFTINRYDNESTNPTASSTFCGIEEIVIPKNVTYIGKYAFRYAKYLKTVKFQENIGEDGTELPRDLSLGDYAFAYTGITEITVPEGVKVLKSTFSYSDYLKTANVPASVTTLDNTFWGCIALEQVNIAETEENPSKLQIMNYPFYNCKMLKSFAVPASVETISASAFYGCSSLTSVTFADNCKVTSIGNGAFTNTGLTRFDFPNSESVITLGTNLFQGCKSLTDVYISKSVVSINNVFAKCTSIKRVIVDEDNANFTAIGNMIVNQNNTTIHLIIGAIDRGEYRIPDTYDTIGTRAFEGQAYITKLVIPKTVRTIGDYAFANCIGLQEVEFEEGSRLTDVGTYAFLSCVSLKKIELPEGIRHISPYMFRGCSSLEEISIPDSVWVIGGIYNPSSNTYSTTGYAFSDCSSLRKINFGANSELLCVAMRSFEYCVSLESIVLPKKVKNIGNYCFAECTSLQYAEIQLNPSESIKSGSQGIFDKCRSLKTVKLPDGLTKLTAYMFRDCVSLESLTIPSSVTDMSGNYIFSGCTNLKRINSDEDVIDLSSLVISKLGGYMFRDCVNVKSVKLPTYVTDMSGGYIFQNSGLTSLDLSANNIKTFGNYMFDGCASLTEVKLPESMTHLGTYTFRNCSSLESITIPSGIKWFGTSATAKPTYSTSTYMFAGCTNLKEVNLPEGFQVISAYVFQNCTSLTTINFPSTLTTIGNYGFQNSGLSGEINLPKSVINIGTYAFDNTDITKVNVPTKLTYTGTYMFRDCDKLTEATLADTQTTISSYMFQGCTSLQSFKFPTALTATGISTYAFRNSGLTSVTIPKNITSLGTSATASAYTFADCENLKEVKFEEGSRLEKIGGYVFMNCTSLDTIVLPNSLTTLGQYSFQNTALQEITIPANTTTIGVAPFAYCAGLSEIKVAAGNDVYESRNGALYDKVKNSLICYPSGKSGALTIEGDAGVAKQALMGASKITSFNIPEGATEIPEYMFYGVESIDTVVIPKTITKIGQYAFASSSVKNVIIEGTPEFGNYIFKDSQLESIAFNNETEKLGTYMFQNCKNLKNITLPDALTAIPNYLFDNTPISSMVIPEGVETIGSYSFRDCVNLTEIVIPASVTKIDSYAFQRSGLLSIVIPETVETVGSSAFAASAIKTAEVNCAVLGTSMFAESAIESITLSDKIAKLPSSIFSKCNNLKTVNLPANLIAIDASAFKESGIESIETPETLETIGANAFQSCTELKRAVIKGKITTLSNYLFNGCTNLEYIELPETIEAIGTGVAASTYVFTDCVKLKEIHFYGNVVLTGIKMFENWTEAQTIYIHDADGKLFENANSWGYGFKRYSKAKLVIIYNDEEKELA